MAITLEELEIKFKAETDNLADQLSDVQNQVNQMRSGVTKAGSAFAGLGRVIRTVASLAVVRQLACVGRGALEMANDVVESEQLFEVSMGKMEQRARDWSEKLSKELALNPYELRKNAGVFNVMFSSMGATEEQAYEMSTGLTKLAEDMASFYNLDPTEAFTKLRAGISGEMMPLRALGILVDETTVSQYAMASGISKTGKNMTQQQKLLARYGTIMQQTTKAQGDLARTLDSPVNQMRRLNNEIDQARIALGQALQPAFKATLPVVTEFVARIGAMLRGERYGETPLTGAILSVSESAELFTTATIAAGQKAAEDLETLRQTTQTAWDEYLQSTLETKRLNLKLELQAQTTGQERVSALIKELEDFVDAETAKGIQDEIVMMMDAVLEDGEVDPEEVQTIVDKLRAEAQELLKKAEQKRLEAQADVRAKLNAEDITLEEANQLNRDIEENYNKTVAGINRITANVIGEVNFVDWKPGSTGSQNTRKLGERIIREVEDAMAFAAQAQATGGKLFEGTGGVGKAMDALLSGITTNISGWGEEIRQAIEDSIDSGTDLDMEKISELRKKISTYTQILAGAFNMQGKYAKSLFDFDKLNAETLVNVSKGYGEALQEHTGNTQEALDARITVLTTFKKAGMEKELNELLKEYDASSYEEAMVKLINIKRDSDTQAHQEALSNMTGTPFLRQLERYSRLEFDAEEMGTSEFSQILKEVDALLKTLKDVDPSKLTGDALTSYQLLSGFQEKAGVAAMQVLGYDPSYFQYYMATGEIRGIINEAVNQIYQTGNKPLEETLKPQNLLVDGADVVLHRPRVTAESLGLTQQSWWGNVPSLPMADLNIEIGSQPINITMKVGDTVLARETIRAVQTVQKTYGKQTGTFGPMINMIN